MRPAKIVTVLTLLVLWTRWGIAEEVDLPAPVLEWSFYILLIFAASVAIGIFIFSKRKNGELTQDQKRFDAGSVPQNRLHMAGEPLRDLLDQKIWVVHSILPNVSVSDCVREMNKHKIDAMLVMIENQLLGIFTERDAITRVLGAGLDPTVTNVSSVMTRKLLRVTPSTTLKEAMGIVIKHGIRHLPVVENGRVVGMVSSGDLTRLMLENQDEELRELVEIACRWR